MKIDAYHQNPLLTGDQGGIPHPPKPLNVNQKKKKIHCLQDVKHSAYPVMNIQQFLSLIL